MVERLQETLSAATIVDLDGTLISGNSMHIFMKRLPGLLMKRHSPKGVISTLWWTALRSLRLVSHKNMKWHLTKIARKHLQQEDWEWLAEVIAQSINPIIKDKIDARRQRRCRTYIATAALEEYSLPLCRALGYDGVIATTFNERKGDYREMKGEAKRDAIMQMLEEKMLIPESFFTDHPDDLPMAKVYPSLTIVVNPTRKIEEKFRAIGVTRFLSPPTP